MRRLWQDMRYGLRTLVKSPGFTLVALVTLALGIGANTAIFSVVDAVLLHPLPYPEPGRIVALYRTNERKGQENGTFSRGIFTDIGGHIPAIENLSAYDVWPMTITGPGEPAEVGGIASSSPIFRLLGIRPVLGREFTQAEDRPGAPPVALISETLWHKRFAGAGSVIGKGIDIAGVPYTIVGVLPAGLRFPELGGQIDLWVPLVSDPQMKSLAASGMANAEKISYLSVLGRLKTGVTLRQAQAQSATLAAGLVKADPGDRQGTGLRVALLEHEVSKGYRTALAVLLGAVGLVLLVACANVANLLLARATTREREIALRMALGAGRAGIVRQMLVESLELSLAGGALGSYLAWLAVTNLGRMIPMSLTPYHGVTVNAAVLGFAAAISLAAGILFGSLPAWHASDLNVYAMLKEGGRGTSGGGHRRLREALVVVEVAMAVMLLAGAGLLLRSFSRLLSTNPGFAPQGIAVASLSLPRSAYQSPDQWRTFVSTTLDRLRAEPGVRQAAAAVTPPMGNLKINLTYTVAGQPPPPAGQEPQADFRPVTPGYFAVMRIPLVAGRDLAASDTASSTPVCVVNQALARVSFRDASPLGRSLTTGDRKPCRIVGVVGDVKTMLGETPDAGIYVPFSQAPFWVATFLARGPRATAALMPLLRDSIRSVDRSLPIKTATLSTLLDRSVTQERFRTTLVGLFAALAILLAAVGISGVMGYSVSRRRQEIGVRMALGALPGDVLKQVVVEGLRLAVIGALAGLVAALGLTRFMRSLLYGVGPGDPLTYAAVAIFLLVVALAACALPALRAARIDPTVALRYE
jgi:putative ABC transport system permease protein